MQKLVIRYTRFIGNTYCFILVGKRGLGQLCFTGKSDFGEVERTSATISGVGDPVFLTALRMFKSQLRFQHREELKFAVLSTVTKFDASFHKDVNSK